MSAPPESSHCRQVSGYGGAPTWPPTGEMGSHRGYFKKGGGVFPGGPVVKTPCPHCRGTGSIPGRGTKIPHAARHGKKKKALKN